MKVALVLAAVASATPAFAAVASSDILSQFFTAPALKKLSKSPGSRFHALYAPALSSFPDTEILSSTCETPDYQAIADCTQVSSADQCGSASSAAANCTWINFKRWDETSCKSHEVGDSHVCNGCQPMDMSGCVPNDIECFIQTRTSLDDANCFETAISFIPGIGAAVMESPAVPGATPLPPSNTTGQCDTGELVKYAQKCAHAMDSNSCGQIQGCSWCFAEYPDMCQVENEQCSDCEIAHEGVCVTHELECTYESQSKQDGTLCYDLSVDFRLGQCPDISFEGPGIRNTTSPTPTPPPPSPLPPNETLCTDPQITHVSTACAQYSTESECSGASGQGCGWCDVPMIDCELEGNRCGCQHGTTGVCLATDTSCVYRLENTVAGHVCAESEYSFVAGQCPTFKIWTGGDMVGANKVSVRTKKRSRAQQGPFDPIN